MKENLIKDLTFKFSIRIIGLSRYLQESKKEWILSKQVVRSGTSIGALVREAEFAQSKADFINKFSIALKEANETQYWIELLKESNLIDINLFESLNSDLKLILSLLVKSIKTSKNNEKMKR